MSAYYEGQELKNLEYEKSLNRGLAEDLTQEASKNDELSEKHKQYTLFKQEVERLSLANAALRQEINNLLN